MKITVEGNSKEIADLVSLLQNRQGNEIDISLRGGSVANVMAKSFHEAILEANSDK